MKRNPWPVTLLLTACFTLSYVDRNVIGLLIDPIKTSLGLTDTQIGLMQGLSFSLFYVVAALPLARLADRGNRPRIIAACITAWSFMTMLCGAASQFWQMMLARIGVAAGEAGLPPAALTLMADSHDARSLARATSIFMLAPFIGGGIALMGGGVLYALTESWHWNIPGLAQVERWQMVFILVGAPGLLAACAMLLCREPAPNRTRAKQGAGAGALTAFLRAEWRLLAGYMLSIALMTLLLNAYVSWLPAALMRSHGAGAKEIGMFFGPVFLVAGSAGTLAAGLLVGRSESDIVARTFRYMRACMAVALPAACAAPLVPALPVQLVIVAAAIFCTSSVLGLSSLPLQFLAPQPLRAQSIAFLSLVSALAGTGLGPLLVGVLSDRLAQLAQPLSAALAIVGGCAALLALALLQMSIRRTAAARRLAAQVNASAIA
jgi:MFS family permease